jgi:hypothetical protein
MILWQIEAETYSLTLQWQDSGRTDYPRLVLENDSIIN